MRKKFYAHEKRSFRLLSEAEIARACATSIEKVHGWLTNRLLLPVHDDADYVEAAEIVSFLVNRNLPVASSLLPARTRKLLFIVADQGEYLAREAKIDRICRGFANNYCILAEISLAGRPADLSILTLAPDMVLVFLKTYNKSMVNTFDLLSNLPECRVVVFVDDSSKNIIDRGRVSLPAHFIFSDALPFSQLTEQLHKLFTC